MVEIEELVGKLKWELELIAAAYPDIVQEALDTASADVDLFEEDGDELLTLDGAFTRTRMGMEAFLDELISLFPLRELPFFSYVAGEVKWIAGKLREEVKTEADFARVSRVWRATRDDEIRLFEPIDAYNVSSSIRDTEHVAERLAKSGPWRRFGFDCGTLGRLEQLKTKTPNFVEVIDCIMDAASLATRYNRPIRVIPILMVGEPGIGKSYFTDQLSTAMTVPLSRIAIDNLQIGSDIAGMSYAYSKSSPGSVFRVLTENDHASPLVILDELDKAPLNWGYGDPLGPLHNLLEPVSAKVFKDASFPVQIDASHVIWIATANELARIPITIRSRFEVFKVDVPSADQFDAILGEICQELSLKYPKVSFDEEIFTALRGMTPREQRKILDRAVARASRFGEDTVTARHIKQVLGHEEPRPKLGIVQEPTGYL